MVRWVLLYVNSTVICAAGDGGLEYNSEIIPSMQT